MLSYPINFPLNVGDPGPINRVADAIRNTTARTKEVNPELRGMNEALYGVSKATENLTVAQLRYLTQQGRVEEATIKYKTALLGARAETDQATAAVERLGNAHRKTITDVQAAGGAIRALEGNLSVRAVEQFTTKVLGLGSAFQAIFPVVGGLALAEVITRGVEATIKLANAWDPVLRAQKESLELQKKINSELVGGASRLQEIGFQKIGLTQGPEAESRARAAALRDTARTSDQAAVDQRQREVDILRKIVNARPGSDESLGNYTVALTPQEVQTLRVIEGKDFFNGGFKNPFGVNPNRNSPLYAREITDSLRTAARQRLVDREGALQAAIQQQKIDLGEADVIDLRQSQASQRAASKEDREEIRVERERRDQYLKEQVKLWEGYEKTIASAGKQMGKIVDERLPILTDETKRQRDEAVKSLFIGRGELNPDIFGIQTPQPAGISGAEQLRQVRQIGNRRTALSGIQSQLAGASPTETINGQYQLRLRIAEQEFDAEVRIAQEKRSQQDLEDALSRLVEKRYELSLQREQQLLELRLKEKNEFEQGAIGLLRAARSGNAGGYLKNQAEKLGESLLVKYILGPLFDKLAGASQGKTVSIGDVLGDAAKQATDQNTTATEDNTDAIRDLTRAIDQAKASALTASGGGGSAGGGISFPSGSGGPGVIFNGFPSSGGFPGTGGGLGAFSSPVGRIASYAGAGFLAYQGARSIARGGARGVTGGIGEIAGAAALVDPEPISKMVLAGVAVVSGIISSIFGDPKQNRQNDINKRLQAFQFYTPAPINVSASTSGFATAYDMSGNIRAVPGLNPYPSVQEPYYDFRSSTLVPGRTTSTVGGPGPGTNITINAVDSQSFHDALQRNADSVTAAAVTSINRSGGNGLVEKMRQFS